MQANELRIRGPTEIYFEDMKAFFEICVKCLKRIRLGFVLNLAAGVSNPEKVRRGLRKCRQANGNREQAN